MYMYIYITIYICYPTQSLEVSGEVNQKTGHGSSVYICSLKFLEVSTSKTGHGSRINIGPWRFQQKPTSDLEIDT